MEGGERSHVERCQWLWWRWKVAPRHQAEERHFGLQSVWFLTSGTRGQRAQPLTTACPDVQFMENNMTQTLNLTDARMLLGWIVVRVANFHIPVNEIMKRHTTIKILFQRRPMFFVVVCDLHGGLTGKYV